MLRLYVPSFYGDIRLAPQGEGKTKLSAMKLTEVEKGVVAELLKVAAKKKWTDVSQVEGGGSVVLDAPIEKVSAALAKALKPGRRVLTAVKVEDGKLIEVDERGFAEVVKEAEKEPKKETPAAAVAVPVRGCVAPHFNEADVAATRVLLKFLTPAQQKDFWARQAFVVRGADTQHDYLVSSRHARGAVFDTVVPRAPVVPGKPYDLTEGRSYCIHDWDVPAAEELLAVALCLQLDGCESHLRELPPEHGGAGIGVYNGSGLRWTPRGLVG